MLIAKEMKEEKIYTLHIYTPTKNDGVWQHLRSMVYMRAPTLLNVFTKAGFFRDK